MYLDSTSKTLEAFLGIAADTTNPTFYVSYNDHTTVALTPGDSHGSLNGTTHVTIVSAPAASTQRQVTELTIYNADTRAHDITIVKDVSATEYTIATFSIRPNESIHWTKEAGWRVLDNGGRPRQESAVPANVRQRPVPIFKVSTGADTAGYFYDYSKDGGHPGAWAPGTPGLSGRATDGTTSTDNGCIRLISATSPRKLFLTGLTLRPEQAGALFLYDILWVNSGIVVTTTTAQTINSVALPARDINGAIDGEGCMIGLLFTGTATNGAVINNSTISYTNSDGTSGRTANLTNTAGGQIPATALVGTVVWFRLQAGDRGVKSIESITLGTSLGAGSVSLIIVRPLAVVPAPTNAGGCMIPTEIAPGVSVKNEVCVSMCQMANTTTAHAVFGLLTYAERP